MSYTVSPNTLYTDDAKIDDFYILYYYKNMSIKIFLNVMRFSSENNHSKVSF